MCVQPQEVFVVINFKINYMSFLLSPIAKIFLIAFLFILFVYALYRINKLEQGKLKLFWVIASVLLFPIIPIIYLSFNFRKK
jgi:hypothetical protein